MSLAEDIPEFHDVPMSISEFDVIQSRDESVKPSRPAISKVQFAEVVIVPTVDNEESTHAVEDTEGAKRINNSTSLNTDKQH